MGGCTTESTNDGSSSSGVSDTIAADAIVHEPKTRNKARADARKCLGIAIE
jgi:hypothetical protein